ncbi:MAG: TetR family transcriptional regulator [Candidatus Hydrogenedentes bacterium]|nr:TetR family transcriptional regulator [Candidatus Hydrogenedentota bacterium]
MVRPSCKDLMLDAAEVLLTEQGAWRLTLDSVAERAQVSKGGLLYHFPTKDALLQALVDRLIEKGREKRRARRAAYGDGPEAMLRADVEGALLDEERNPQLCAALVAALANCPNLKAPILKFHEQRVSDLESLDVDQEEANILLLAADGLMLMESLNVSPFSEEQRRVLVEAMLAMASRLAGARV